MTARSKDMEQTEVHTGWRCPHVWQDAVFLSSKLFDAGIENVVWEALMMRILGVYESPRDYTEFIVPDEQFDRAITLIRGLGGVSCDSRPCRLHPRITLDPLEFGVDEPCAAAHFHNELDFNSVVKLNRQSEILWFLPDLKVDHVNILLANDDRLGWKLTPDGRPDGEDVDTSRLLPLCVPAPHRAVETLIRLRVRDLGLRSQCHWDTMLLPLVDPDTMMGKFDPELMESHFCEYAQAINEVGTHDPAVRQRLLDAEPSLLTRTPPANHSVRCLFALRYSGLTLEEYEELKDTWEDS